MINQSLPRELYKGQGAMGTSVTVLRTGPIIVTATDNYVFLALPVQLTFRYAIYESYPLRADLRFKARGKCHAGLASEDRSVLTRGFRITWPMHSSWGPISLKPKAMVEGIVLPVQRLLAPFVDAKANESVQLRAKITPLWQNAFAPILLNKDFSTWLKLTPERIVMSPLLAANNQIRLSIGLMTGAEITVGPRPAATPAKALPAVQLLPGFDRRFHIRLVTDIFLCRSRKGTDPPY